MTLADWLARHPYLQPVAELHAQVDGAIATIAIPTAAIPDWTTYVEDFHAGIPLLQSSQAAIDLAPVDAALDALLDRLSATPLAARSQDPGWQRFLRSRILARYVGELVRAFDGWRNEDRWLRNACPMCGSGPAMAQLVGNDPGRLRVLSCGSCRTRWRYRRTGCPFCENRDDHRLAALDVEGEGGLRLDYCEACRGYLKAYNGTGSESVLLADWTSLHLDVLARDRGLERRAASLYDVPTA
jgi:FdhE protein